MSRKKILILGAGVGGMEIYKFLHRKMCFFKACQHADITVVNSENYYTFVPMLHEAATDGVSVEHVISPVRQIMDCHRHFFLKREVRFIDIKNKLVKTNEEDLRFDFIVIALGSRPNFLGVPGAEKYSYPLRTAGDAWKLRKKISSLIEDADEHPTLHIKHPIHIVVVGGGPVGVEAAGQFTSLFKDVAKLYTNRIASLFKITLMHGGDRLLPMSHMSLGKWAEKELKKRGVEVRINSYIAEVGENHVAFRDGSKFSCSMVVWGAGFEPSTKNLLDSAFLDDKGFVKVDSTLAIAKHNFAFAIGDNARIYTLGQPFGPYMLAQSACRGARVAGRNILEEINGGSRMRDFKFRSKGTLVPIGDGFAVAELFGFLRFKGRLAWFLRRAVFLIYVKNWRDRVRIALEWFLDIFGTREITS